MRTPVRPTPPRSARSCRGEDETGEATSSVPRAETADAGLSVPPLGLAYIAAVARDGGHDVEIIDAYALDMSWSEFEAQVRVRRPDVLGLSAMTPVADVAARAVNWRAPTRAGSCWADPPDGRGRARVLGDAGP